MSSDTRYNDDVVFSGGVVDMPALFTVDTCGETGSLGFSIEGPSQAKINCKDNGNGSASVLYQV